MSSSELHYEFSLSEMQKNIKKAGGLFYQYRPCRRNSSTIYDIENIRHGVVYAQTPLNMNDPFDSMIGYSAEEVYTECISMLLDSFDLTPNVKLMISSLAQYRAFGKLSELISLLNDLKRYLIARQQAMHKTGMPFQQFVAQNINSLFSKLPSSIKNSFSFNLFNAFAGIIVQLETEEITEESLSSLFQLGIAFDELQKQATELRQAVYEPSIKQLLSETTISCFSVSGWDNQLMWAHYANSYSGFCIEYDFRKVTDFIGFIYPVHYSTNRPKISLRSIGIAGFCADAEDKIIHSDPDSKGILSMLLTKNTCWRYEEEWRIINFGEANKPRLIELPFISSITFGINIDPICKMMILDVCKLRNISCYQLVTDPTTYQLHREKINIDDIERNSAEEIELITVLANHFVDASRALVADCEVINSALEDNRFDYLALVETLEKAEDLLCDVYILKNTLNRLSNRDEREAKNASIPTKMQASISGINYLVSTLRNSTSQLYTPLLLQTASGKVPINQSHKIGNQIKTITELAEKVDSMPWPFALPDENDTN